MKSNITWVQLPAIVLISQDTSQYHADFRNRIVVHFRKWDVKKFKVKMKRKKTCFCSKEKGNSYELAISLSDMRNLTSLLSRACPSLKLTVVQTNCKVMQKHENHIITLAIIYPFTMTAISWWAPRPIMTERDVHWHSTHKNNLLFNTEEHAGLIWQTIENKRHSRTMITQLYNR